ncbi:MAG: hypothetical protein EOO05_15910 [Chitinophagaceae bacterium]|nr:MAG: hypothetical protein EOO05_15910 [Chitinophagaceae bacterium]
MYVFVQETLTTTTVNTMPEPTSTHLEFFPYEQAVRIKEELSYYVGQPFRFDPLSRDKQVLVLIQIVPCRDDDRFRMNLVAQGAFLPVKEFCELNEVELPGW